jgi:hypothetical protein
MYEITKAVPYKDGWLTWPKTALTNMDISDCNDTVTGTCTEGGTLGDCIENCEKSQKCNLGIFVNMKKQGKTVCAPIDTSKHPYLNPVYRLRPQSIYEPIGEGVEITTFIGTRGYNFPPGWANVIFFKDILTMKKVGTNMTMSGKNTVQKNNKIKFDINSSTNIEIEHENVISSGISSKYFPILFGSKIKLRIPGTSLMSNIDNNNVVWYPSMIGSGISLTINAVDKKEDDLVTYSDNFTLSETSTGKAIILDKDGNMVLSSNGGEGTQFQCISKMYGYYCNGEGNCTYTPVNEIIPTGKDKNGGTKNGKTVYRGKSCYGMCNSEKIQETTTSSNSKPGSNKTGYVWIISGIILFFVLLIFLLRKK